MKGRDTGGSRLAAGAVRRCEPTVRSDVSNVERDGEAAQHGDYLPPSVRMNCTRRLSARFWSDVLGTSGLSMP